MSRDSRAILVIGHRAVCCSSPEDAAPSRPPLLVRRIHVVGAAQVERRDACGFMWRPRVAEDTRA